MADSSSPTSGAPPEPSQHPSAAPTGGPPAIDPVAVIRSRAYLGALVLAAIVGIPISAIAYGFLALVAVIQHYLFTDLPNQLFGAAPPAWWPVPWLLVCGLLTALTIRYLPGNAGHSPAFGFKTGGGPATGPRASSHSPRRADHTQPRRSARARSTSHRDRRRAWSADRTPREERCAADGHDGHGIGRQFCRDQHAARFPRARRISDHGGSRDRRHDAEPGGVARPARIGHRGPGLRWSGQLDWPWHVFACSAVSSAPSATDGGDPWLGR